MIAPRKRTPPGNPEGEPPAGEAALSGSPRITNLALELMGAQTVQRLAAANDARAHHSQAVRDYGRSIREHGLKETLRRLDEAGCGGTG